MDSIRIETGNISLEAELNGSATAISIYNILPLSGSANTWGDEVYFSIPLQMGHASDARQEVEIGDLGYWPAGNAFCIFFGPTPVRTSERPKAYSPVNVFGHVREGVKELGKVHAGDEIRVIKEI